MKITVKLYALLGRHLPTGAKNNQIVMEVEDGTTPWAILDSMRVPREACHLVLINGEYLAPSLRGSRALHDEDALAVWPPIAGG